MATVPPADDAPPAGDDVLDRLLAERSWLRALARTLVVDDAAADDLAQDAAVVALTRPPTHAGALRGWLRRVARNLASNARRGQMRRTARESSRPERPSPEDPARVVAEWETRRAVVDAVLALDEPYRSTILLRFFEERSLDEIAALQGVSAEAAKSRQRRAIQLLRGRLAHLDDGRSRRGLAVLLVEPGTGAIHPGLPASPSGHGRRWAGFLRHVSLSAPGVAMSTLTKVAVGAVLLGTIAAGVWLVRDVPQQPANVAPAGDGTAGSSATTPSGRRAAKPAADAPADPASAVYAAAGAPADADPDTDLTGVVVDPAGAPIPAAVIAVVGFDELRAMFRLIAGDDATAGPEIDRTVSGADGAFRVRLPAGTSVLVRASAPGRADVDLARVQPGDHLRIVLGPPSTLRVLVRGDGGAPMAGAAVRAAVFGRKSAGFLVRRATTDADGRAEWRDIPRLPGDHVQIEVRPGRGRLPRESSHSLADTDVNEFVVDLGSGHTVDGRVVDAATGAPVPDASIGFDPRLPPVTTTASDGTFRLHGWPAGPNGPGRQVRAWAAGYATGEPDAPPTGETSNLEIRLAAGFDIAGRVAGPDGTPVAGAVVIASADGGPNRSWFVTTSTAADGSFRAGPIGRSAATTLEVRAAGFADAALPIRPADPGVAVSDAGTIRLSAGRTVRGRVEDEDGAPLPNRQVVLEREGVASNVLRRTRRTNRLGTFEFPQTAEGAWKVSLRDATSLPVPSANVVVVAGSEPAPVTISLAPPPAPPAKHELRAKVTDADGNPVPDVKMYVGYANGDVRASTDAAGNVTFGAAYEPQHVSAWLSPEQGVRYLHPWRLLRPGETDLTLVLERAEPVSGRVLTTDGSPVANAWVKAMQGSRQVGAGSANAQGEFAFGVPPGAVVDLMAEPPTDWQNPDPSAAERAGVPAGTTGVELTIGPVAVDRAVDVRILGLPDGAGATASVWFTGQKDRRATSAEFRDGVARLTNLPRKSVEIRVQVRWSADAPNDSLGMEPVRIDGTATAVTIAIPAMRTVRGVVVDESGAPCPGAHLFSVATMSGTSATAGPDGRFEMRLPATTRLPLQVIGNPMPFDRESPRGGFDLLEREDQELRIVVRALPKR